MPKKQARNGFYYFMLDFKKREEKRGNRFPGGFKDIQADPKCSQEWAALSAQKKKEYNEMAKREKFSVQTQGKLTGTGESVELLKKQELMKQEYERKMRDDIDSMIDQAEIVNRLDLLPYYLIHVNWFYKKTSLDTTVDYIPAEFAVLEFTINEGVRRLYHQIINIDIEMGYARETLEVSESTHKLTTDVPGGEKDYKLMYKKLIDFLNPENKPNFKLPPLYTVSKMKTIVPCLFKRMTAAAGAPEDTFELYSLEYLFGSYIKYLDTNVPDGANLMSIAEVELEKEEFRWAPNIECSYHMRIEGSGPFCSQSIVYQWVYTICDRCCEDLDIKKIPGVHCPRNYEFSDNLSLVSSLASMRLSEKKEEKFGTVKSETGVSEEYRIKVSERTWRENEERKKRGGTLTIIDHSKLQNESRPVDSDAVSTTIPTVPLYKPLRPPKTMAKFFDQDDERPVLNDEEFPTLGGSIGRGKSKKSK